MDILCGLIGITHLLPEKEHTKLPGILLSDFQLTESLVMLLDLEIEILLYGFKLNQANIISPHIHLEIIITTNLCQKMLITEIDGLFIYIYHFMAIIIVYMYILP
jgi:uncharacterized membrane protein YadS